MGPRGAAAARACGRCSPLFSAFFSPLRFSGQTFSPGARCGVAWQPVLRCKRMQTCMVVNLPPQDRLPRNASRRYE